ncbi:MAG: hypothetical protein E7412_07240 [Ruminococcaceae bacterium]|nr:hypothetical protein [Oscillospiraceae bacterium]
MKLDIRFKNSSGEIQLSGGKNPLVRLTEIFGLGLVEKEYRTAVFPGYDGQETVSERALPRTITISAEFCGNNISSNIETALKVLESSGYLYIETERFSRRIFCNQIRVSEPERILRGEISNMAVQFVCDSPFFEDSIETVVPLYERTKNLETEFSLPCIFGSVSMGTIVRNTGNRKIEPIIILYCPDSSLNSDTVTLRNVTTGKTLVLEHNVEKNEIITIDIKNRTVLSNLSGNILYKLSDDSFLGDFCFEPGKNTVEVALGDASYGFFVECRYVNLHCEAVMI